MQFGDVVDPTIFVIGGSNVGSTITPLGLLPFVHNERVHLAEVGGRWKVHDEMVMEPLILSTLQHGQSGEFQTISLTGIAVKLLVHSVEEVTQILRSNRGVEVEG